MQIPQTPLILPYGGVSPRFASPLLHAGPGAAILGHVTIGKNAWLDALSVMRADGDIMQAGDDFHLGARSTLHIAHEDFACIIGDRVTIGANACVHACQVGSDVIIEDNVVILDGAVVDDHVVIEAGATVYPGKRIPGGYVYAGSPARPAQPLVPGELEARRERILRERNSGAPAPARSIAPAPGSQVDPSVFIASTANVRGRFNAAASSSVWFSCDFDAGNAAITVGPRTNVQDNTVIRCTTAQGVTVGRDATIGHNVLLHDCVIHDEALIGIGAVVAAGTVVESHVLLASKSRTEPGQVLESGFLYAGNPARKLAPLDREKREMFGIIIATYCQYSQDFKAAERELAAAR